MERVTSVCLFKGALSQIYRGKGLADQLLAFLSSKQSILRYAGHCYGCRNNGSPDMQHPSDTGAYTGGHLDEYLPFGGDELSGSEDEEAVEGRLRHIYRDLDDPSVWERINSYFDRARNTQQGT